PSRWDYGCKRPTLRTPLEDATEDPANEWWRVERMGPFTTRPRGVSTGRLEGLSAPGPLRPS
ncbi:MAG: hypothetical protein ACKOGA_08465, partial [Planctomycetaceae bacterium]